ncbi:MAG: cupin domain-containing protein [Candidatus Eiseniibacteriota bacterium]
MSGFQGFDIKTARERIAPPGAGYAEFVRTPDLSIGLYVLPVGGTDHQSPHYEDESYHVVSGRARFTAGSEEREVSPGDTLFVPARLPHHFHSVVDELVLLVFFGPAEGSRKPR